MIFGYIKYREGKKKVQRQLGQSDRTTEKEIENEGDRSNGTINSDTSGNSSYFDPPLLDGWKAGGNSSFT